MLAAQKVGHCAFEVTNRRDEQFMAEDRTVFAAVAEHGVADGVQPRLVGLSASHWRRLAAESMRVGVLPSAGTSVMATILSLLPWAWQC